VKVGDLVKLNKSERRNGRFAGKLGIVIDLDAWENPTINVEGEVKSFHYTQVEEIIYASR
jgi:hypothetical protein